MSAVSTVVIPPTLAMWEKPLVFFMKILGSLQSHAVPSNSHGSNRQYTFLEEEFLLFL